uniref:Uncharacterized protein n=1 Tax=Megaselia scalaris TaxID=36166 RepID=T1GCU0_MEGSC
YIKCLLQTLPYPIPQPKPTRRPNYKIELIRAWLIQVLAEILVTLAHFPGKANALMRKIPAWNPFDSKSSIVDKPSVEDMMKRPQYMLLDESETSEVEQVLFDEPEK